MHHLEACLNLLARRIRAEGDQELANEIDFLAGASAGYLPETEEAEKRVGTSKLFKDLCRWEKRQET